MITLVKNYVLPVLVSPITWIIVGVMIIALLIYFGFWLKRIVKESKNFKRLQKIITLSEKTSRLTPEDVVVIIANSSELSASAKIRLNEEDDVLTFDKETAQATIKKFFTDEVHNWLIEELRKVRTPNQLIALQVRLVFEEYRLVYEQLLAKEYFDVFDGNAPLLAEISIAQVA